MTPPYAHHGQRKNSDSPRRREGTDKDLIGDLHRIDGRPYGTYKSLTGNWDYGDFSLSIDRVQSDPYAPPTQVRAITTPERMGLPAEAIAHADARLAAADFLARTFENAIRQNNAAGTVRIAHPGQEILQRSSATVLPDRVEVRFQVHLPARGRTIRGHEAAGLFDVDIPNIVMDTFDYVSDDPRTDVQRRALRGHIATYEDHCALQELLEENGWLAFVGDHSVLARKSGVSQLPMTGDGVIAFESPESMRRTVTLPHAGEVSGMVITPGITLIVGGGYHGKSTLLGALQRGVYAHIPGDGRELVATVPTAVKVRAADGRAVTGVDVSPFISHLPGGIDTTVFSTENASGSTSQAAAIVESVEMGAQMLLIDEDTSATNLLIRDSRMRELVHADKEPITPLVDRIGALAHDRGVSVVMVMGGSGDYLDVADQVIMLDEYRCRDVTERAREVVAAMPRRRSDEPATALTPERMPARATSSNSRPKTKSTGLNEVMLDRQIIDLTDVEQIVDPGQTEAIAWFIRGILEQFANGKTPLPELLKRLERQVNSEGLDAAVKFGAREFPPFLVRPRLVDIGAAINRYRVLKVTSQAPVMNEDERAREDVEASTQYQGIL
ncbi:ABC-ATPase domain-containing protein [Schaalia sp. ZJ405]|uniref:ABC-ATPase domain-containing protein n=1 Tax=Schaalia sp. ZJ405 TaxID=2709403 RepID=UPI0013EC3BBC|nr:ABC-ATPase domain-containing protein [Schaalia sp. ZJ405]QPK81447.1 ABC-ATPase domain-containing protein [Schaalia sp. ZJ405]